MKKAIIRIGALLLLFMTVQASHCQAQAIGAAVSGSTKYRLLTDISSFHMVGGDANKSYTALNGSRFIKVGTDGKNLHVRFITLKAPPISIQLPPNSTISPDTIRPRNFYPKSVNPILPNPNSTNNVANNQPISYIVTDREFYIDTTDTNLPLAWYRETTGAEWGALVAPFKLSLRNWSLSASSVSLAPYYAFSYESETGHSLVLLSAGLALGTNSSTSTATGTSTSSGTSAGLSVATGYLFQPANNFQMGILLGADYYGATGPAGQTNRINPWICFQIGTTFTSSPK